MDINKISLVGLKRAKVVNNASPNFDGSIELYIPEISAGFDENVTGKDTGKNIYMNEGMDTDGHILDSSPFQTIKSINKNGKCWARPTFFSNDELEEAQLTVKAGYFKVPKLGSWIYMFFEDGDILKPYWLNISPTVNGNTIDKSIFIDSVDTVADPAKMANISVLDSFNNKTVIYYDENPESNSFIVKLGTGHIFRIAENDNVSVMQFITSMGQEITIDDKDSKIYAFSNREIECKTKAGNYVKITDDSDLIEGHANTEVKFTNNAGSYIDMKDAVITGNASSNVKFTSGGSFIDMNPSSITCKAPIINLNP